MKKKKLQKNVDTHAKGVGESLNRRNTASKKESPEMSRPKAVVDPLSPAKPKAKRVKRADEFQVKLENRADNRATIQAFPTRGSAAGTANAYTSRVVARKGPGREAPRKISHVQYHSTFEAAKAAAESDVQSLLSRGLTLRKGANAASVDSFDFESLTGDSNIF